MGTEEHLGTVELRQFVVVDGDESQLAQSLTLHAVVNDIAKTIKCTTTSQLFLSLLNGRGHAEAKAAAVVNLDGHFLSSLKYWSSRSAAATKLVFWPWSTDCSASGSCCWMSGLL